jgi:hypothetical protein
MTFRESYGKEGDVDAAVVMFYEVLLSSYPTEFVSYSQSNSNMIRILGDKSGLSERD